MAHVPRLTLIGCEPGFDVREFAADVRAGLTATPKRLSCRWFYDRAGSELFERICALPEYYLTRAEAEILDRRRGEIASLLPEEVTLVELGSGSASKTRKIIEALLQRHGRLRYVPVDISRSMLEDSARALIADYPSLQILAVAAEYQAGLRRLASEAPGPKLILWLGSNAGNFHRGEAAAFLRTVRDGMADHDRFLIGIDLRKDPAVLEAAYDDAEGVTARFNLNLLARINEVLDGHFDPAAFRHRARYDVEAGRIEMFLESLRGQTVAIDQLGFHVAFAAGERIHTENSYKYSESEIAELARGGGFGIERQWLDGERRFSLSLFAPA
jgi:L-histidine Nalpha-methyltransferase